MAGKCLLVVAVKVLKHLTTTPPKKNTTSQLKPDYISYFFTCVKPFLTAYRTGTTVHPI